MNSQPQKTMAIRKRHQLAISTVLLLLFTCINPMLAQPLSDLQPASEMLDQETAVHTALRNNPNLAQMQARFEALREIPSQVGTWSDPMINFNAMNLPTDTFNTGQEPMTQLQIGFSQMIPFPGKLSLKARAAEFDAIAAEQDVVEARSQLQQQVVTSWWQVYYLDRAVETVVKNQQLLRQFIIVAETKYQTGKGLQQDVLLSQLELSKLLDQQIQLQSLRRRQAIALNVLMDRLPDAEIVLSTEVSLEMPALKKENQLYGQAESTRAKLKQLDSTIDAAEARLKLAKRNYYPDFTIGMTYGDRAGLNALPRGGDRTDFVSLMVGIRIPFYAKRKQAKAVAQKRSELEQNQHKLRDVKGNIFAEVSSAVIRYQQAKQQFSLFKNGIIPQASQTVASMLAAYQVDEVDFLNLVRSQITLFNYELQYWKTLSDANQALSRLYAAVGEESVYE